jgi:hypothetical protein
MSRTPGSSSHTHTPEGNGRHHDCCFCERPHRLLQPAPLGNTSRPPDLAEHLIEVVVANLCVGPSQASRCSTNSNKQSQVMQGAGQRPSRSHVSTSTHPRTRVRNWPSGTMTFQVLSAGTWGGTERQGQVSPSLGMRVCRWWRPAAQCCTMLQPHSHCLHSRGSSIACSTCASGLASRPRAAASVRHRKFREGCSLVS